MLGTRTFERPDGPGASTLMTPLMAFHRWTMSLAWRPQKSLMTRLLSAARRALRWQMSSSRAPACLSSSSCSWPCMAGQNPGDAPLSASVNRSAAVEWTPCRAAFGWYAAGAQAHRASNRRIAAWSRFPLSEGSPLIGSNSARDGYWRPSACQGVMRWVEVFEHLVNGRCSHGPVAVLLGRAQPARLGGLVLCSGDRRTQVALDWRGFGVVQEKAALRVALGHGHRRLPCQVEEAG